MATAVHCAFCFETIAASLEDRKARSLGQVEKLWEEYMRTETSLTVDSEDKESLHKTPMKNSQNENLDPSSASIATSSPSVTSVPDEAPMFVTWDTVNMDNQKRLRGCIGTFEPYELEEGLRTYARIAAFEDHRFRPISERELPTLECSVTLLTDFEPAPEPMDWEIGKHGIRISFHHNGRRYGSTYLPDVAREQGWTKTEAMVSLMKKAGWSGRSNEWTKVKDLKVIRYQGKKVSLDYDVWIDFKTWSLSNEGL